MPDKPFLYVWQTSSNNTHTSATSSYRVGQKKSKVDLKQEVCAVIKQKVKVDVNPQDILEIHRIPGNRNKKCPANTFDLLFQFLKFSRLKSNISRTKGIWIGLKINSNTICSGTVYQFSMDDRTFQNSWRNIYC